MGVTTCIVSLTYDAEARQLYAFANCEEPKGGQIRHNGSSLHPVQSSLRPGLAGGGRRLVGLFLRGRGVDPRERAVRLNRYPGPPIKRKPESEPLPQSCGTDSQRFDGEKRKAIGEKRAKGKQRALLRLHPHDVHPSKRGCDDVEALQGERRDVDHETDWQSAGQGDFSREQTEPNRIVDEGSRIPKSGKRVLRKLRRAEVFGRPVFGRWEEVRHADLLRVFELQPAYYLFVPGGVRAVHGDAIFNGEERHRQPLRPSHQPRDSEKG